MGYSGGQTHRKYKSVAVHSMVSWREKIGSQAQVVLGPGETVSSRATDLPGSPVVPTTGGWYSLTEALPTGCLCRPPTYHCPDGPCFSHRSGQQRGASGPAWLGLIEGPMGTRPCSSHPSWRGLVELSLGLSPDLGAHIQAWLGPLHARSLSAGNSICPR